VAVVVWSIFAVGGVYPWSAAPLIAGAAWLTGLAPPRLLASRETRVLDGLLLAVAAAAALQLLPMPPGILDAISPHAGDVFAATHFRTSVDAGWRSLSVAPWSSVYGIALMLTALVVFWTARRACTSGLALRIVRAVAFAGLLASLVAIVLRASGDPRLIYGRWEPIDAGAHPFGPFVNRNHFATWVLMAWPLAAGYVGVTLSRTTSLRGARATVLAASEWLSTGAVWVAVSGIVMLMALVLSMSRSGLFALAVSLVVGGLLSCQRLTRRSALINLGAGVPIAAVVIMYVSTRPLLARVGETLAAGAGGRTLIWRETARVIRDFPLAGVGLGGYQTAMLVYQQSDRAFFINQAHNQYLHLVAEGGLLLSVPVALAAFAFIWLFRTRLRQDTSSCVWLRIGGATAIAAVAAQSLWETGLRIPANGLLFAVAAAIAVHRPRVDDICRD
jgi:O-antigen ligase